MNLNFLLMFLFTTYVNAYNYILPIPLKMKTHNFARPKYDSRRANIYMNTPKEILDLSILAKKNNIVLDTWSNNDFINNLKNIDSIAIVGNQNVAIISESGDLNDKFHLYKYLPSMSDNLIHSLINNKINFEIFDVPINQNNILDNVFQFILFYLGATILFNIFSALTGRGLNGPGMGGPGMGNPFNAMKKDMNMVEPSEISTKFNDVAGLDEAKEELEEIVDYLKNPFKYVFSGARIPKGVLLEGPPGTGKTLMARAVAGEAGVSFISASGSEFIEMFVGVGAQRVRQLFKKARENKPCVIFIDEIDAVGGRRGSGFNSGGNDEREQTLNQILTNMDGFEKDSGIIVMAATNRIDTLDEALIRSGRFDRRIKISNPDFFARQEIAKVHFKNKPNVSINYDNLASFTSGFSGADLENLANEAALLRVKLNKTIIDKEKILKAFEKITIGLPKKYENRGNNTLELVAYHEIGHAMMVKYFNKYFTLQKVTLNANTGGAGGYTLYTPKDDFIEYPTKGYFLARLILALGGRAAEIVLYKNSDVPYWIINEYCDLKITTGAASDLKSANEIAKQYFNLFESYLPDLPSEKLKGEFEFKSQKLINECLEKAIMIIEDDIENFHKWSKLLIKNKTIDLISNTVP